MRQVSARIIGGLTVANTKRLQNPMVALAASLRYGSAMLPAVLQAAADSPIRLPDVCVRLGVFEFFH